MAIAPTAEQAQVVLDRVKSALASPPPISPFLSLPTAARYLRGYMTETKAFRNMLSTFNYRQLVHADRLGTNVSTFQSVWTELSKRSMFIASLTDGEEPPSPVIILRKRGEGFDKADFEEYRRAFFYTLDVVAKLADQGIGGEGLEAEKGQWVIVMDLLGYSSKNSPPLAVSLETMRIFQSHFPERAKKIVVLDAPAAFSVLWRVVGPLIDAKTRAKFVWVKRDMGEGTLKEVLGEKVWECVEMELEMGKKISAGLMVEHGFLLNKLDSTSQ